MRSITFSRSARNGRFYTYQFNGVYQDKPTYLADLAETSILFKMLITCKNFKANIGNSKITGYTDKNGNKILQIK